MAFGGYPAWYWLTTAAGLSAGSVAIPLPAWWGVPIAVAVAVALVGVAYAAGRARGVCEGWSRGAMTRQQSVALYGPATVVILASAVAARFASWSPWWSIVAAVLVFGLFVGAGLTLRARATRR